MIVDKWQKFLDKGHCVGAILMDLSKAFDCMNHELLIAKLHAYGFSMISLKFIWSYLSDRKQRVEINESFSFWEKILSGVLQGFELGPLLFNIYLDDMLLYDLTDIYTEICNFADDNTLYNCAYL